MRRRGALPFDIAHNIRVFTLIWTAVSAALISAIGRKPAQRTTLYQDVDAERRATSFRAAPLAAPILTPAHRYEREQPKGNVPLPRQRGEQLTKIGIE